MAFQPFGYRFSVVSTLQPVEAKAKLRAGMKGWFDPRSGPRGWIVGPVFCFWQSAFDRRGPMAFGAISAHNLGTRVRGRAGSDLNGVLWAAIVFPLLAFLLTDVTSDGAASTRQLIVFAVILLLAPTIFWFAHKDRRHAEPLVNFVRRALGEASPMKRQRYRLHAGPYLPMELTVTGERVAANATPRDIRSAVEAIQFADGFLVLSRADEEYMQVALTHGEFVLERREGSEHAHFAAHTERGDPFVSEEIVAALVNYLAGVSDIPGVRWEPVFP